MYHDTDDVPFKQRRTVLMHAKYAVLLSFSKLMRFLRKLLENAGNPRSYESISLHTLVIWRHSKFPGGNALKIGANRTYCKLVLNSAIPDDHRTERKVGVS